METILKILRAIPFFETLTEEEHKSVIQHISMQFYPAHYSLFKKGDGGDFMLILKSGIVQLTDENRTIATLGEGDFFGEMALIEDKPRMASAETLSDCEIFILKKEDFIALMNGSPAIAKKVQNSYESRKINNELKPN